MMQGGQREESGQGKEAMGQRTPDRKGPKDACRIGEQRVSMSALSGRVRARKHTPRASPLSTLFIEK